MIFTPTTTYNTYAASAGKTLEWSVYTRIDTNISGSLPLSSGSWTDVTGYVSNIPTIKQKIEYDLGQYSSDSVTLSAFDIEWWNNTIFTGSVLTNAADNVEVKIMARVGLNDDFAADSVVVFSGVIDKASINFNEVDDTVDFDVLSYDALLGTIQIENLTTQIKDATLSGGTVTGSVLLGIPGVYITNVSSSGYVVPQGVHSLTYEHVHESGSGNKIAFKFADGAKVSQSFGYNGTITTYNKDNTQKVTLFVTSSMYTVSSSASAEFIVDGTTTTFPKTWRQREWVYSVIKDIYARVGLTDFTFDNFLLATWDGRKIVSYYEQPPADNYYGKVNAVRFVSSSNCLYMGIKDKLFKKSLTTNEYTDLGVVSSSYNVVRLFQDDVTGGDIWGIVRNDSTHQYGMFSVNPATDAVNTYALTERGTGSSGAYGHMNFAYVPHSLGTTSGSIWYLNTSGADGGSGITRYSAYEFNISTCTSQLTYTYEPFSSSGHYGAPDYLGLSDGASYYVATRYSISNTGFRKIYWNGSAYTGSKEQTDQLIPPVFGCYLSGSNKLIWTGLESYGPVLLFEHVVGAGSSGYVTDIMDLSAYSGFMLTGSNEVLLYNNTSGSFCIVNGSTGLSYLGSPAFVSSSVTGPDKYNCNDLAYDAANDIVYGVTNRTNLLFKWDDHASMYIDEPIVSGDNYAKTLNQLLRAYNLVATVSPNKSVNVLRRGDDNGTAVSITSASNFVIDENIASGLKQEKNSFKKFTSIDVNGTSFNGTSFNLSPLLNERVLSIENTFIPTALLEDMAYYLYQYFSTEHNLYSVELGVIPYFQYEPLDGATLTFNSTKIPLSTTGIIYESSKSMDGTTTFKILV